jgi:hypothetical protein
MLFDLLTVCSTHAAIFTPVPDEAMAQHEAPVSRSWLAVCSCRGLAWLIFCLIMSRSCLAALHRSLLTLFDIIVSILQASVICRQHASTPCAQYVLAAAASYGCATEYNIHMCVSGGHTSARMQRCETSSCISSVQESG